MKSDGELAALALPYAVEAGLFGKSGTVPGEAEKAAFCAAMPLIKERASFLREIPAKLGYLFAEPAIPGVEEFIPKKGDLPGTIDLLRRGRELIGPIAGRDDGEAETFVKAWAEKEGLKLGDLMMPLRVALTGERVSPPLFGSIRILGIERSLARVDRALAALSVPAGKQAPEGQAPAGEQDPTGQAAPAGQGPTAGQGPARGPQ
jgi:glutamyl-tRNA synthetase